MKNTQNLEVTEQEAQRAVRDILAYIGEDPTREGLLDTPSRVVKAWDEMTRGYGEDPERSTGSHVDR